LKHLSIDMLDDRDREKLRFLSLNYQHSLKDYDQVKSQQGTHASTETQILTEKHEFAKTSMG